jgi:hypothetical protein
MSDTYCHLCDTDPCYCGQHGKVKSTPHKATSARSGPRGLDEDVREFVLTSYEAGVLKNWRGWLDLIKDRFGHNDHDAVRHAWNRVNNELQRKWLLIDDPASPDGPMRSPSHYPQVKYLSLPEAIAAVEQLIASGGWVAGEKGLRLWQVARRLENVAFVNVYDALHDMNRREYLVTTKAPSGSHTMFWYVRP